MTSVAPPRDAAVGRRPWAAVEPVEYRELDLAAHDLLADVPLHDVWRVFLPGAGRRCTMADVRAVADTMVGSQSHGIVLSALFGLRRILGAVFRWDGDSFDGESRVARRIPDTLRRASLVAAGTADGPFRVVYVTHTEAVHETRNATVEAYLVWAIRPVAEGHDLFLAVHVLPTGTLTRPYLAVIGPFRRLIVYPTLLRRFHDAWMRSLPSPDDP